MVQVNLKIPGYLKEHELEFLGSFVRDLPENATIIDIGCGWGREAWVFSKNAPASTKIFCTDIWGWKPSWPFVLLGHEMLPEEQRTLQNSEEEFRRFIADCENITALKADKKVDWDGPPADFIFFDEEDEIEEVIVPKLHHWLDRLKPGGVIAGADYYPHADPPVKIGMGEAVRKAARDRGKVLVHPPGTGLWMMFDAQTMLSWRSGRKGTQ